MSIENYKKNMIRPLWELERREKISYNEFYNNIIQKRYWMFLVLKYR